MRLQKQPQPPQQQRHVRALRAVIRVELIEHHIPQRIGRLRHHLLLSRAQQQLVEHLVVGEQNVRWILLHRGARLDNPMLRDRISTGGLRIRLAGVLARPNRQRGLRNELRQTRGLVIGQRVHRVQDNRLDTRLARLGMGQTVVDDGVEERLRLTGTRTRNHQRRLGRFTCQTPERIRLVLIRLKPRWQPRQNALPVRRRRIRQTRAHIRPVEHPVLGIEQEVPQRIRGRRVRQREARGQVLGNTVFDVPCALNGQQVRHGRSPLKGRMEWIYVNKDEQLLLGFG